MIVDCFPFFQENDILALRLYELDPVVDYFVIVEANQTHKGDNKPSYLDEAVIAPYSHKIIRVTVDLPPGDGLAAIWRREITQRQGILHGLQNFPDDTVILISDCDEIPRRTHVPNVIEDGIVLVYDQTLFYYNLNTRSTVSRWRGTRATTAGVVRAIGPDGVRYDAGARGGFPHSLIVPNAGWHLSYFGGAEAVKRKADSFLHQELHEQVPTDLEGIQERIEAGHDLYGRDSNPFTIGPAIDLPAAVHDHPMAWSHLFKEGWSPCFHEDWTNGDHCRFLSLIAQQAPEEGAIVEIGCWEGRSTVALANAVYPRDVIAVDHWEGNTEEGDDHPSVVAARERNIFATFQHNIQRLTQLNVYVRPGDWRAWRETFNQPIAFCYLDAAHDETSVRAQISAILPLLVSGGILCGDDFFAEGVRAAVTDLLPGFNTNERVWAWRKQG